MSYLLQKKNNLSHSIQISKILEEKSLKIEKLKNLRKQITEKLRSNKTSEETLESFRDEIENLSVKILGYKNKQRGGRRTYKLRGRKRTYLVLSLPTRSEVVTDHIISYKIDDKYTKLNMFNKKIAKLRSIVNNDYNITPDKFKDKVMKTLYKLRLDYHFKRREGFTAKPKLSSS